MICREAFDKMKDGVIILNFARDLLVDDDDMEAAIKSGKVKKYITDFPNEKTSAMEGVIAIPHLGASTEEAEDNCAVMAVDELRDYLENGNIRNSVNFPNCEMARDGQVRVTIAHKNVPNMLSRFSSVMADKQLNIVNMINKSKKENAYTIMDIDGEVTGDMIASISDIDGVLGVRIIP